MTSRLIDNPYTAGFGLRPPYFAGRKYETMFIGRALNLIQGKSGPMERSPSPAIVLIGPRGVGKTVLLDRTLMMARDRGINTAEITPSLLTAPQHELVSHLFPEGWIKNVFGKLDTLGVSVLGTGFKVGKKDAGRRLRSAMPAFLSKNPLLLVLDEAHRCESKDLNMMFENIQICLRACLPLAVVLAGTPGLEPLLRKCDVTYVERSKFLDINTLSRDEAVEAIELPAKEAGRPIETDALKIMLDWADSYPFFIQMVGGHAWDASNMRSGKEISVADAEAGLVMADHERIRFYDSRHEELRARHLAEYAAQIVIILRDGKGDSDQAEIELRLKEMNEGMDDDRAMEVVNELQELGFLWKNNAVIEPGIPSMFDYVLRKHKRLKQLQGGK